MDLDKCTIDKLMDKYPQLEIALRAGVVSMKMVRELIDVDRWLMQDIYKKLVVAGAVEGVSSSCFKASKPCKVYLQERAIRKGVEEDGNSSN